MDSGLRASTVPAAAGTGLSPCQNDSTGGPDSRPEVGTVRVSKPIAIDELSIQSEFEIYLNNSSQEVLKLKYIRHPIFQNICVFTVFIAGGGEDGRSDF